MMNLNRKRSASPSASQEELDQLTAMHLLKRQRLAQAAAAAEAFFRPSIMDMPGLHNGGLFHPGAARLRFLAQQQQASLSPYYGSPHGLWGAGAPMPSMDMMPMLPSMPAPGAGAGANANAPPAQDSSNSEAGLEQLSAFASHMPTMPVPMHPSGGRRKVDAPASSAFNTSPKFGQEEESKTDDLLCAPVNATSNAPAPALTLPLKTMKMAKKLKTPVMDNRAKAVHWEDRPYAPLAINEDANWLSEFQCFLRSEILEVFIASPRDLETRAVAGASKKKISSSQVGIRCRFCAHLHPTERASRASAFPSSVRQIYQSFTMMLREHLNGQCEAFPDDIKQHFAKLKGQSAQSASDSKRYWIYAAQKLGMVDTPDTGIQMSPSPEDIVMKPFGASDELEADLKVALADNTEPLVGEADKPVSADFTYTVVTQAVRVHLAASEKIGNRSCLTVGLPGLACLHCAKAGRSGLSRVFPARKRNLKTKVHDLYDHLRRCELTPTSVKEQLQATLSQDSDKKSKVFYARLWRRLGHESEDGKSPILEAVATSGRAMGNVSPITASF